MVHRTGDPAEVKVNPESGLYRFTGTDGSLGYRTGNRYRLSITLVTQNGVQHIWVTFPFQCPYSSTESFYANWEKVNLPFPIRSNAS